MILASPSHSLVTVRPTAEHYLTQRRKEIDHKYDFSSSRLTDVLGRLLYENRLGEEDLSGLCEDRLESIRSFAKFLAEDAAA